MSALTGSLKKFNHASERSCHGYMKGTYTASTVAAEGVNGDIEVAAGVLTITPGFVPRHVKVINVTDRLIQEWFDGMNQGDFLEEVAAGDKTLETDDQISVDPDTGVVTVAAAGGAFTDNDTLVFQIEG